MTVAVVLTMPGGTAESVAELSALIADELGDRAAPEGQVLYLAGPSADGWCMVEVWESWEAVARWQAGGLANAMRKAGGHRPAPKVSSFQVHRMTLPGTGSPMAGQPTDSPAPPDTPAPTDTPKGAEQMPTPGELFAQLEDRLKQNPNKTAGLTATYQFNITGENGGTWYLQFDDGVPHVAEGPPPNKPDVTQTISSEDYVALATGQADGQELFFSGRLRVEGDAFLGMRLGEIMRG